MKLDKICNVFDALSNESRLKIFLILVENANTGITPTEISEKLKGMPRNTLSFHLALLTNANLCSSKKEGKQVIYKPNCDAIRIIASFLLKDCCKGTCSC